MGVNGGVEEVLQVSSVALHPPHTLPPFASLVTFLFRRQPPATPTTMAAQQQQAQQQGPSGSLPVIVHTSFEGGSVPQALQWSFAPQTVSSTAGGHLAVSVPASTGWCVCVSSKQVKTVKRQHPSHLFTLTSNPNLHTHHHADYWQRTHYGFRTHNAPFLHAADVRGDFVLTTVVTTHPRQRFDQAGEFGVAVLATLHDTISLVCPMPTLPVVAHISTALTHATFFEHNTQTGLMVEISPSCWLKCSVESGAGEPGRPSQLGVVVTNAGFSDWSTQDFPSEIQTVSECVLEGGKGGRGFFSICCMFCVMQLQSKNT